MSRGDVRMLFRSGEECEVRVMAEAEGWAMVRRKGCAPFVCRSKELATIGLCGEGCGFPNCECQVLEGDTAWVLRV